jgi:hypothetical protein
VDCWNIAMPGCTQFFDYYIPWSLELLTFWMWTKPHKRENILKGEPPHKGERESSQETAVNRIWLFIIMFLGFP